MKRKKSLLLVCTMILFFSCKQDKAEFDSNFCKGSPPFVRRLAGFTTADSYFSTSEIRKMGLVLVEKKNTSQGPVFKYYQHPSWTKAGWLSPIQLDEAGNVYTAPAPFINVIDNPVSEQNKVYKVDAVTAEMNEFIQLPLPDTLSQNNPYGALGLAYLCDPGILYVSSIAGSDRHAIRGGIFAVDTRSKKIIDQVKGIDAIGMGISYVAGKRQLFFGTGRDSEVYVIGLKSDGRFSGDPLPAFSLAGLGPRGDDKVRRMRTDPAGNLFIYGIEFNYNLIAPREKPETVYEFLYDKDRKIWWCKSISQ